MIVTIKKTSFNFFLLSFIFIVLLSLAFLYENYWLTLIPFGILVFYAGWLQPGQLFFLLIFTLPFSFEYNFTPTLGTDIPDEPLMWLTSLLFASLFIFKSKKLNSRLLFHPLLILLVSFLCWTCLSALFSVDIAVSLKFVLAKGWYVAAFVLAPLVIFNQKNWFFKSVTVLTGAMVIVTCIIIYRQAQTGFHFASVNDSVSPFFRNHVNFAAMLVCTIPITLGLFVYATKSNQKILLGFMLAIFMLALFFSYSRGAWLALLIGFIAYWLIKKRLMVLSFVLVLFVLTGLFLWLKNDDRYLQYAHDYKTTIFHKDFSQHLVSTYELKDLSTEERFYRWIAGIRMIKENWLTGSGPNSFYPLYKSYTVPAYKTWVSGNPEHSTVHNYFLLIAIEQGIPGLLLLLILVGAMLYYAERGYQMAREKKEKIIFMVTGIVITMIMVLNFFSDLIETDKIGSLFFLCIAILAFRQTSSPSPMKPSPPGPT